MKYPVAIDMGNGFHAYGASVPDVPGCFGAGESLQATLADVRRAIRQHCEDRAARGERMPPPRTIEGWRGDPAFTGCLWSAVDVPLDDCFPPSLAAA
jgi:predicted RNase H-like HicB family nuclease